MKLKKIKINPPAVTVKRFNLSESSFNKALLFGGLLALAFAGFGYIRNYYKSKKHKKRLKLYLCRKERK